MKSDFEVCNNERLSSTLRRLLAKFAHCKFNIFLEGDTYHLEYIQKGFKSSFGTELIQTDPKLLKTHIPPGVSNHEVAFYRSTESFFVLVPEQKTSELRFSNASRSNRSCLKNCLDLANLFAQRLKEPCFGVVIDAKGPYRTKRAEDYILSLQVTDESIFPGSFDVIIFQKEMNNESINCLCGVVLLEKLNYRVFRNKLIGYKPSSAKKLQFVLPGKLYFKNQSATKLSFDQQTRLYQLHNWVRAKFQAYVPLIADSIPTAVPGQKRNLIVRVHSIKNLGQADDPKVLLCYNDKAHHIVFGRRMDNMWKHLKYADTVRLSSLVYDGSRYHLTRLSSCFLVPSFTQLEVQENKSYEVMLSKQACIYNIRSI